MCSSGCELGPNLYLDCGQESSVEIRMDDDGNVELVLLMMLMNTLNIQDNCWQVIGVGHDEEGPLDGGQGQHTVITHQGHGLSSTWPHGPTQPGAARSQHFTWQQARVSARVT